MAADIVEQLIQESMKNVAGVDGRIATDTDKILVVIAHKMSANKSVKNKAAEAAIPVGGVSIVAGALLALIQVLGVA